MQSIKHNEALRQPANKSHTHRARESPSQNTIKHRPGAADCGCRDGHPIRDQSVNIKTSDEMAVTTTAATNNGFSEKIVSC